MRWQHVVNHGDREREELLAKELADDQAACRGPEAILKEEAHIDSRDRDNGTNRRDISAHPVSLTSLFTIIVVPENTATDHTDNGEKW